MDLCDYKSTVSLLLQLIPHVAKEQMFAMHGGTAINFFVRDMPRMSVDIDLTYLPIDNRQQSLSNISQGLTRIKNNLVNSIKGISVELTPSGSINDAKLNCQLEDDQVKIEVTNICKG